MKECHLARVGGGQPSLIRVGDGQVMSGHTELFSDKNGPLHTKSLN